MFYFNFTQVLTKGNFGVPCVKQNGLEHFFLMVMTGHLQFQTCTNLNNKWVSTWFILYTSLLKCKPKCRSRGSMNWFYLINS